MKQSLEDDNAHHGGSCQVMEQLCPRGQFCPRATLSLLEPHNYSVSTVTIIPFPDESGGLAGGGGSSVG